MGFKYFSRLVIFLAALASLAIVAEAQKSVSQTTNNQNEAQKAWDSLIRTKGGRDKLYSVTNILTESYYGTTRLFVMSNRLWQFSTGFDGQPDLDVNDGHMAYAASSRGTYGSQPVEMDPCDYERMMFLLETKSCKPEILGVTRVREGKRVLDVIQTVFSGSRVDLAYEPEEQLVGEARVYWSAGEIGHKYRFDKYVDVDGIKMPTMIADSVDYPKFRDLDHFVPVKISLNVDYDPKIFEPPFIATTKDTWKRKPQ
ncbi:MAG: hypothetical protein JO314_04375 [Acidobacteria bacterium]|nr:hypothetical protein [Acidobacteriota bacterium]